MLDWLELRETKIHLLKTSLKDIYRWCRKPLILGNEYSSHSLLSKSVCRWETCKDRTLHQWGLGLVHWLVLCSIICHLLSPTYWSYHVRWQAPWRKRLYLSQYSMASPSHPRCTASVCQCKWWGLCSQSLEMGSRSSRYERTPSSHHGSLKASDPKYLR